MNARTLRSLFASLILASLAACGGNSEPLMAAASPASVAAPAPAATSMPVASSCSDPSCLGGADALLTPRDMIREFIGVLNILESNPEVDFDRVVHGKGFKPVVTREETVSEDRFADFTL